MKKCAYLRIFKKRILVNFKRLVVALKINPQKYNWPQKIFQLFKNKFPGSNWSVILMRIKQSEVYDKVLVTEFGVFLTRRGTVTDFLFLRAFENIFQEKIHTTFLGLP